MKLDLVTAVAKLWLAWGRTERVGELLRTFSDHPAATWATRQRAADTMQASGFDMHAGKPIQSGGHINIEPILSQIRSELNDDAGAERVLVEKGE